MSTAISDATELKDIEDNMAGTYHLVNDIDLDGAWEPIGRGAGTGRVFPGGPIQDFQGDDFTGSFNGRGYKIYNGAIEDYGAEAYLGVFARCNGATISNVCIDVDIDGGIGALGGLAGAVVNSTTVTNCYSIGGHSAASSEASGGLIGVVSDSTVSKSFATGNVNASQGVSTGGLVGLLRGGGEVSNCYARGDVTNRFGYVGGLVGAILDDSDVENSYSTGAVSASNEVETEGGLVGWIIAGSVTKSYYDSETSGRDDDDRGEPRTTVEMTYSENFDTTFIDWDFVNIWRSDIGHMMNDGYPIFGIFLIPVASPEDLDHVRGGLAAHTFAEGIPDWEITLQSGQYGLGKNYIQIADIDLDGVFIPIGYVDDEPSGIFTGNYNGNNHKITGLEIDETHAGGSTGIYVGLFSQVNGGTFKNITIEGASVDGYREVGILLGLSINNLTIENCKIDGDVSGQRAVGGLVGETRENFDISWCSTSGALTRIAGNSFGRQGGLVGDLKKSGTIKRCISTMDVTSDIGDGGDYRTGGLVGESNGFSGGITIEECYAKGEVICGDERAGGLVGEVNHTTILNCYARGDVGDIGYQIGGLVGLLADSTVENCYSTGIITIDNEWGHIGGLVGENDDGTVTNSYYDTQTSGRSDDDGRGEPRTTAEMTYPEDFVTTFIDWDFDTIWTHDPTYTINDGYPPFETIIDEDFNIWVKKGGVWHPVTDVWVKRGGVWNPVTDVSTKKGGVWNII